MSSLLIDTSLKKCFFKWAYPGLFFYFCLFYVIQLTDIFLWMLGFEPRISGVGSVRSANCATTTAKLKVGLS